MDEFNYKKTIKLFKCNVNFVYEEIINQFLNHSADCKEATFCLINWSVLLDPNYNNEIYGKLDTKTVYKCFVTYLVKLFSKYIKEGDSDLLVHLKSVLSNENLFSLSVPINYAITNEFIKPCLKKMANLVKQEPNDKNTQEFINTLKNQDIIEEEELNGDYSAFNLFEDVCLILKQVKYLNDKSLFKTVFNYFDENIDENELSNKFVECAENTIQLTQLKNEPNFIQDDSDLSLRGNDNSNAISYETPCLPNLELDETQSFFIELADVEVPTKAELISPPLPPTAQRSSKRTCTKKRRLSSDDVDSSYLGEGYETKFSEYLTKKPHNKWTEKEVLYLVYLVEMYGKKWAPISKYYKKYLNGRNSKCLEQKYLNLEKNKINLENLKKQAELLNGKRIVKENVLKGKTKWTHDETLYLVYGFSQYGRKWMEILNTYKEHFQKGRNSNDLHRKFQNLEMNPKNLEYFKNLVADKLI